MIGATISNQGQNLLKLDILTERETLTAALAGFSLSRFGDGELRLAVGGRCISQEADPALALELRLILQQSKALCCIPTQVNARTEDWARYFCPPYAELYREKKHYGSAFITRPDNAPEIDTPDYWDLVESIWRGREVTLVGGTLRSLTPKMLSSAKFVRWIQTPATNAYAEIDRIEAEIGFPRRQPVLLCVGATATVLAERLAVKGIHALDLGHIGMFMKAAGAYRYAPEDLASGFYREQLQEMHATHKWGGDGGKHAQAVRDFIAEIGANSILDYGCGREKLAKALPDWRVHGYDPGIRGKDKNPKPVDLVVCTDVLEHVEPGKLPAVLDHIFRLARIGAYFVVATRPAKMVLPNGKNAHLLVETPEFWVKTLQNSGWKPKNMRFSAQGDKEVRIWARK